MMTNESTLMLHSALSGSSTNQLDLDSTDPKDLFSYKTALGANSSGITIVGRKRNFSALSPAEFNLSIFPAGHQGSRDLRTIIGSTGQQLSNTMILIFLIFRVGDLLLKLSIWLFYPLKSIF